MEIQGSPLSADHAQLVADVTEQLLTQPWYVTVASVVWLSRMEVHAPRNTSPGRRSPQTGWPYSNANAIQPIGFPAETFGPIQGA